MSLPSGLARPLAALYDQQLRQHAAFFSNEGNGRADSSAYLDRLFHRVLALSAPTLLVEAGAYKAETSRRVRLDHPECRVVALEANPYNHTLMQSEHRFAELGVDYRNVAVDREPGHATFHLRRRVAGKEMREITGNSSLLERVGDDTEYERIEVPAISLDSEFGSHAGPRSAWIDVEGASGRVLPGGSAFLAGCDVVMIEVEEVAQWQDQWLSLDVLEFFLEIGLTPVARDIEYENQYNLLFVGPRIARRADVLLELQLHDNFLVHHLYPAHRG